MRHDSQNMVVYTDSETFVGQHAWAVTVSSVDSSREILFTDVYVAPTLLYLQGLVRKAFGNNDPHHGLGHALAVERNVFMLCDQPEVQVSNVEKLVLRSAALLHDIGYAAYEPNWSNDRREHVAIGLDLVFSQLRNTPIFAEHTDLIDYVVYLIAFHDDTNYQFPSAAHDGRVDTVDLGVYSDTLAGFAADLAPQQRERLYWLLHLLREADAMAATNNEGARRTFDYSRSRDLPIFGPGDPLRAWRWDESAIGNVRLGAKRAVLDAISESGKTRARHSYQGAEAFVEQICALHNIPYTPECDPVETLPDSEKRSFRLTAAFGWPDVVETLRGVVLLGDETLRPYKNATIAPRKMEIDKLRPTAYYALKGQMRWHHTVVSALQERYALSLFDLSTTIECELDGTRFRMAPPLVETYHEPTENRQVTAIVDGLHRVLLARQLGLQSMWVIDVSDIPPEYPLVPLPLDWEDVELCDTVPPTHAKRQFRFPELSDFPRDIGSISHVPITQGNYLYFFYRDLSALGSEGVRSA